VIHVEVLIERTCGLDVHTKTITAGIVTPEGKEIKTFRTHTVFLIELLGLVPGHNESAGKRKPSKTRKGNKYLRAALTEAANSIRGSDNYLGAQSQTNRCT
jgi:hypothetical protein